MKSHLIGLLTVMTAGSALCGHARPNRNDSTVFKLDLPPVPIVFPALELRPLAALRMPAAQARVAGICGGVSSAPIFWCGCGRLQYLMSNPPRKSKLPDPISTLGAAYLKCRMVNAAVLDPEVPVAYYPAGHFGSWVEEGVLVTNRFELTDETEIRQVFTLLAEAIGDREEWRDCWVEEPAAEKSLSDFRQNNGFFPELSFAFVGDGQPSVKVTLSRSRVLVQAGDAWEVYTLDRWSALALRKLLIAKMAP